MDKKNLLIAIDPGYDQYKVVINNTWFAFPSTIIKVEEEHEGLGKRSGNFYYYSDDNRIFLFGSAAENQLSNTRSVKDNQELLDLNKSNERFQTGYFKFSIEAALAYSLFLYENSNEGKKSQFTLAELNDYNTYIGIALPHDHLKKDFPKIKEYLICKHDFKFQVAGIMSKPFTFDFDLSTAKIIGNSQAVCAFLHQSLNDDLTDDEDYSEELPCLVYDAGYKTVGRFLLGEDLHPYAAESNTEFAMYNTYKDVANRVNELLPNKKFEAYRVQKYLKDKKTVNGEDMNGSPKTYSLEPFFQEELEKTCMAACDDLKNKWATDLEDSKMFLLAGGTGAAYYPYFTNYMKKNYPGIKVVLADKPYLGKKIEPIFAISIGMMKFLRMKLAGTR